MRRIEVIAYQTDWPTRFTAQAKILRELLGEEVIDIHHIGSTSIPGTRAKPIIDMLVVVRALESADQFSQKLIQHGYLAKGEFGVAGRRFFVKGTEDVRSHHVHVFQDGHPRIARYLRFREYLKRHPEEARTYGQLKEKLAEQFRYEPDRYMAGKEGLIAEIHERAKAWFESGSRTT